MRVRAFENDVDCENGEFSDQVDVIRLPERRDGNALDPAFIEKAPPRRLGPRFDG